MRVYVYIYIIYIYIYITRHIHEFLKIIIYVVLDIINKSYKCKQPNLCNISIIVPVPKSGDLNKADNYRGISLTSVMTNTYNRMLHNRIRPVLDHLLRPNKN